MTLAVDILELPAGLIRLSCVSLPGCVVYGASYEEACLEMQAAIRDYFTDVRGVPMTYFGPMPPAPWN